MIIELNIRHAHRRDLMTIQVSFLGYFAGCVDHNNMPVVSGDGKDESKAWRPLFRPGPEPVRARVLLVDYVNKAIRLTLRPHLVGMRAPSGLPPTGALLEGEVVRVDPALGLLLRVRGRLREYLFLSSCPYRCTMQSLSMILIPSVASQGAPTFVCFAVYIWPASFMQAALFHEHVCGLSFVHLVTLCFTMLVVPRLPWFGHAWCLCRTSCCTAAS